MHRLYSVPSRWHRPRTCGPRTGSCHLAAAARGVGFAQCVFPRQSLRPCRRGDVRTRKRQGDTHDRDVLCRRREALEVPVHGRPPGHVDLQDTQRRSRPGRQAWNDHDLAQPGRPRIRHAQGKQVGPAAGSVDAKKPYKEIDLGVLDAESHRIKLPYGSDWAIAVGRFADIRGDGR